MALDAESFSLLRASVQRFIDERLKPAEDTLEEIDDVPADIVADMKEETSVRNVVRDMLEELAESKERMDGFFE